MKIIIAQTVVLICEVVRMTCKECIHEIVCGQDEVFKYGAYECTQFKNKADFVEVVRCKDCKHQEQCCEFIMISGKDKNIDFCSYGERK